jgi:hypothetical protein
VKAILFLLFSALSAWASGPSLPPGTRFIMSHFRAAPVDEKLYISISPDGLTWTALNNGNPVWQPLGAAGFFNVVRDPAIIFHDGWFWVAYTSGNYGRHASVGLVKSQDLLAWQSMGEIPAPLAGASDQLTWNPTFFRDGDGTVHLFVNISPDGGPTYTPVPNMRSYELHPLNADWTQWSAPALVPLPSANTNELWVWREGEIYHAMYVDFGVNAQLVHATSTQLLGGWTNKKTLGYDGFEGAMILKKPNGGYRLFGESQYYDGGTLGYRWFDLNDQFGSLTLRTYFIASMPMINGKMIAAPATTSYADWQAQHLAALPAADQLPLANPDQDAMSNLLECAFDQLPRTSGVTPMEVWTTADGTRRLRYVAVPSLSDVTLSLETTTNLQTWPVGAPGFSLRSSTLLSDGRHLLEWVAPPGAPQFFHLKAVLAP